MQRSVRLGQQWGKEKLRVDWLRFGRVTTVESEQPIGFKMLLIDGCAPAAGLAKRCNLRSIAKRRYCCNNSCDARTQAFNISVFKKRISVFKFVGDFSIAVNDCTCSARAK